MTNEEYINQHPEQFKDDIDKWLFTEFSIIGGCCSAEKSHEYHIARMVAEKLNDAVIDKACEFIKDHHHEFSFWNTEEYELGFSTQKFIDDFKNYMKGESDD